MRWSDIPFSPTSTMLRQFAGLWLAFFGGLASWQAVSRGHVIASVILFVVAVLIGGIGLVRPQAIRMIFVGWMIVAFPVGWIVSLLLLGLVYFGLVLPTGLISRLTGRDPLHLKPSHDQPSYWTPTSPSTDVRRYFRPY